MSFVVLTHELVLLGEAGSELLSEELAHLLDLAAHCLQHRLVHDVTHLLQSVQLCVGAAATSPAAAQVGGCLLFGVLVFVVLLLVLGHQRHNCLCCGGGDGGGGSTRQRGGGRRRRRRRRRRSHIRCGQRVCWVKTGANPTLLFLWFQLLLLLLCAVVARRDTEAGAIGKAGRGSAKASVVDVGQLMRRREHVVRREHRCAFGQHRRRGSGGRCGGR
mmetsp:Transcript_7959/g.24605  ORF Transcript_7959/g.24605 Transcript_7959/m.24605 type:complete len:217 (+) Transcript_7959:224-874(+)